MRKKIVLLSFFIAFLASCQKKTKNVSNNIEKNTVSMKNNEITILKNQLRKGLKATIGDAIDFQIEYSNEDLQIEEQIIKDILKQQGFKNISNSEFNDKINSIFDRKLNYSSSKKYVFINCFKPCDKEEIFFQNNLLDYNGYFIFKDNNFIAPLLTIPELIDYQKKYPEIIEYEKDIPYEYLDNEGNKIKIHKWGDNENLSQIRHSNIQRIVARNKYLFNDSKADFVWLKVNDKDFLRSLVLNFGYTKDKDLLKWVMESVKLKINPQENNVEEFGKLLWHKDCSSKLKIHIETFEAMHLYNKKEYPKYEDDLYSYIFSLNDEKQKISTELSFSEKAKITAYCLHFTQKETNDIYGYIGKFAEFKDIENDFSKEFEKNNYYDIPNFKNEWKEAKEEGDGMGLDAQYIPSENTTRVITSLHLYDRPDFSSFSREIVAKDEIEIVNQTVGWNFVKVNGVTGYLPTEGVKQETQKKEKHTERRLSFLADEEDANDKPRKKGFWGGLFS